MEQSSNEVQVTEHTLGKGAVGTILKGFLNKNPVAIKKIHLSGENVQYEQVVLNGINIQCALKHDNVVKALLWRVDRDTNAVNICVVLEYMSNGDLSKLIFNRNCLLDHEMRLAFMKDIVNGLDYLHEHGIIHRDIKSDNVLLDVNMRAKLADFDMAVELDSTGSYTSHNRAGSPNIFAPELLSPDVFKQYKYKKQTDIYALGILLYEVISRKLPYLWAETYDEVYEYVLSGKREPIQSSTLKKLEEVYTSCVSHESRDRPSTQKILTMLSTADHNEITSAQKLYVVHKNDEISSRSSVYIDSTSLIDEDFEEMEGCCVRGGCCIQ
jgi:serine/threonine protein kinase